MGQKHRKKAKNGKTIVMTGGHAGTTALSVLHELQNQFPSWETHWIGPKVAHEGKNVLTIEAKTFPELGVKFHAITAGKLQRKWSRHTIPSLLRLPVGFLHAGKILRAVNPDLIVSFGGYAAFPVVVIGWLMRIPIILQEQITGLGFANRISLPFAKVVALAREEGLKFANGKGRVIGNPVNRDIAKLKRKSRMHQPPAIFVFAGSRGSKQINQLIQEILPRLLSEFVMYHHTGDLDFKEFENIKLSLPKPQQKNYHPMRFIEPSEVPNYFEKSDIMIGRAGANTVSELMVVGIPSVLIPLTWTNYQEQVLNAENAKKLGFAEVYLPDEITSEKLYKTLVDIRSSWKSRVENFDYSLAELDTHASRELVGLMSEVSDE